MLIAVNRAAAVIKFTSQVSALAAGQVAVVKSAIYTLLSMDLRVAMVQTVLLVLGKLAAYDTLVNASVLVMQALVDRICLRC